MKSIFVVKTVNENGKFYSWVEKYTSGNNLIPLILRQKSAVCVHLCENKTHAVKLSEMWNAEYKENGTFLFGNPAF